MGAYSTECAASIMYPDDESFWKAATTYKHTKLEDSYSYPQWRRDILAHLKFFGVLSKIEHSRDMKSRRNGNEQTSRPSGGSATRQALESNNDTDSTYYDSDEDDGLSLGTAQSAIVCSLSDEVEELYCKRWPFTNAAAMWDHLHDEYGTPSSRDVSRAHQKMFPRGRWEEKQDIPKKIRQQQHAALVLSAAGMPLSSALLNFSHLQYLPLTYYQSADVKALTVLPPDKLTPDIIVKAVDRHFKNVSPTPRQKRCYYHNTDGHDTIDCYTVRRLLKRIEKSKGRPRQSREAEERMLTKIFEQRAERDWYCDRHGTSDHDNGWCIEQLKERLRS